MINLFSSQRFKILSVIASGKKQIPGGITATGLPSVRGDCKTLVSAKDGVVLSAERCKTVRHSHKRVRIEIQSGDHVVLEYCRVGRVLVKKGDIVKRGDPIALQGEDPILIEARRNGRLIDITAYLNIPKNIQDEFRIKPLDYVDEVGRMAQLSEVEMNRLRQIPNGESIFEKIFNCKEEKQVW